MNGENPEGGLALALLIIGGLGAWTAIKAGCIGMALWFDATYPRAADRMTEAFQAAPRRCVVLGLVNAIGFAFIGIVLLQIPPLRLIGAIDFAWLAFAAVLSYGPAYRTLGDRLDAGRMDGPRFRTLLRGALVCEASYYAPLAGQLLSIGTMIRGLGAVMSTLLSSLWVRSPRPSKAAPTAPSTAPDL